MAEKDKKSNNIKNGIIVASVALALVIGVYMLNKKTRLFR
tara:strand:- start:1491 stop:1610 length:120 start_codon:yes stop_codon:yes gene_type:complete